MRIGIYGGSFNPPHNGHQEIARKLIALNYVDKVICVPASGQYVKGGLLPFDIRFEMLSKIFEDSASRIVVSRLEENNSLKTLKVMEHFKKENPDSELFYILGADNLFELDTWYEYETLLSEYKFLVIERDGIDCNGIASLKYKEYLNNIIYAKVPQMSISASSIRKEILENGFSDLVLSMVGPVVVEELQKIDYRKYWI